MHFPELRPGEDGFRVNPFSLVLYLTRYVL
jgi:hypothetical protein